ncbi:NfeD family protein [Clostridium sp. Marseille-P299]|uniref:NfeD family protein n=1 Tax=Clostridium sp. Marseille-P299 TaxID=1805477 RepID=UPI00082DD855|nr:NfeD family protein [Clostridium sp. Marseille-P299]
MEALYWLIALAVLLVIEIFTLGLTTIWFAGGALIAFFASLLGANLYIQIILFFVVSFLMLFFTRPVAIKYVNKERVKTNYEGLIGKIVKITSKVDNYNQTGTAVVNGTEWTVRSDDDDKIIEAGTKVKIVDIVGVKLIVAEYKEEL